MIGCSGSQNRDANLLLLTYGLAAIKKKVCTKWMMGTR